MKHYFLKHILLCFCLFTGINALAYDAYIGGIYYNLNSNTKTATVTCYSYNNYNSSAYSGQIVIPETVTYHGNTYNVTSIGEHAFYYCTGLTFVAIPESVTNVGKSAFYECTSLTSVTIPNSVTSIDEGAFYECTGLAFIIIPESVTSIGKSAFLGCTGLTFVAIPNSVTSIGDYAFKGCTSLTSVTIGSGVTSIGEYAFSGCDILTSVKIESKTPTVIRESTFSNRGNAILYVPAGCLSAYQTAQYWNEFKEIVEQGSTPTGNTNNISFADARVKAICVSKWDTDKDGELSYSEAAAVTSLGNAFCNNAPITSFNELRYFTNLNSIPEDAFKGCTGLTSVNIPNSVTSIGFQAFSGCTSLTAVHISDLAAWCKISFQISVFNYNYGFAIEDHSSNPLYFAHHLFLNGEEVKDLVIPDGVTSIRGSAFYGCTGLTSVNIPNSVTSIGYKAFYNCTGLTSVNIPNSVTSISNYAFSGCKGLTSVNIPNSVTSIGQDAFSGCTGLTSVNIPNSVTSIGQYAFSGCTGLTSVNIPNSVTSIGYNAFQNCTGLTAVHVSDLAAWCNISFQVSVSIDGFAIYDHRSNPLYLANHLFLNGKEVKDLVIPDGVTNIGGSAFYGCTGLTSVTIPESVTSIGEKAFYGCTSVETLIYTEGTATVLQTDLTSITSVTIPESVASIGQYAFSGCTGLTSVNIPNSVTSVGKSAFYGCTGMTSVTIPNSVTNIDDYAFGGCTNLASVMLGTNVKSVGKSVFENCNSLSDVTINSNSLMETFYYEKYNSSTHKYESYNFSSIFGPNIENYIIGDSVTTIGAYAFHNCIEMKSITISNGVTTVGKYAFYGCTGLTNVIIPEGVTSIDENAFYGCTGLTNATIPESMTSIGKSAFQNCTGLTTVTIPKGVTRISEKAFFGCTSVETLIYTEGTATVLQTGLTSITSVTIPESVTSIDKSAFSGCTGLTNVTIPEGVTSIGENAFYGCTGLTAVTIPESMTSIGKSAFYGCTALKNVTINSNKLMGSFTTDHSCATIFGQDFGNYLIGNNVITIGSYAFSGCTGLTFITIPESVTSIGRDVFDGCNNLNAVHISDIAAWCNISYYNSESNPLSIAHHLFLNGEEVKDLVIPEGVTSIGNSAFFGCSDLTSVTIPSGVTTIGAAAFSGCSNLNAVHISDIAAWCNISFNNYTSNPLSYAHHLFLNSEEVKDLVIPDGVSTIKSFAFYGCTDLTSVTIPSSVTAIGREAFSGCKIPSITLPNDVSEIGSNAFANSMVYVNRGTTTLLTLWNNSYYPYETGTGESLPAPKLMLVKKTQSTLTVMIGNQYDEYSYKISKDNGYYYDEMDKAEYTYKCLRPDYSYTLRARVYNGNSSYSFTLNASTEGITPAIEATSTASSLTVNGSYADGDATVISQCVNLNGETVEGNVQKITGLNPNQSFEVQYSVTIAYGDDSQYTYTFTEKKNVKTASLKLTTLQPKVISAGNVIVAAESNLDDEEEKVGFEWRRSDWTDDFASNTGGAYLYEGTMEGYIRNLYTEKLWKYRPFYESNAGNRYYGDWVGLDPTNTSYFEPTVHTYASINISGNTAEVKGYAMRGSDNVVKQGFMYWKATSGASGVREMRAPSVPANAMVVEAKGNVMVASLENLDYDRDCRLILPTSIV